MLRAVLAGAAILGAVLVLGAAPFSIAQENADETEVTDEADAADEAEPADEAEDTDEAEDRVISVVPAAPDNPVALAAYEALDRNCARCHQAGALIGKEKPSKNFGFVLDFEQLKVSNYISAGNPDGSDIVKLILNKQMPFDIYQDFDATHGPAPSADEVAAIRDWITALAEDSKTACADHTPILLNDIVQEIASDLDDVDKDRVEDTRYLTLSHLANICVGDEKMKVYRQGAVKLLNSMSRSSDIVVLETIDEEETIIRFNLRDMGWSAEDWDVVLAAYPYAVLPDTPMAGAIGEITDTAMPFVRADWFAATVSKPPLYHELLELPETFQELEHKLGLDTLNNIEHNDVDRAGFQLSGVSANNRLIERHSITIGSGYFWTSYDFAGNRDRQSLFEFPLGPGDGDFAFSHDGGESIFSLANGFQGYYLNAADGKRLDQGPTAIVRDQSRRDLAVTNGISCIGCHSLGIRRAVDEIRPHVSSNRSFPNDVEDDVEAIYPTREEMDAILTRDALRFEAAMKAAGLDPGLMLNGIEMTTALAEQYDDDIDITLAAAEFDLSIEDFIDAVSSSGDDEAIRQGKRLQQGLVPRDGFEAIFPRIVEYVTRLERPNIPDYVEPADPKPADEGQYEPPDYDEATYVEPEKPEAGKPAKPAYHAPPPKDVKIDLALYSNQREYYKDDLAVFTVTSNEACYLTLLNVDSKKIATVLFPNKFEDDNYLRPGREFAFPGPDAGFQFRLGDIGTETVIAICSTDDKLADNIKLDPEQTLTDLGNYEQYLTRQVTLEAAPKREKGAPPSGIARTAIKFDVR